MPAPTPSPDALRVVLFGMPDAGKSSLLGALAQAAQSQEPLLGGHLIDRAHGLDELKRRVYEDRPQQTPDEIVPYPIDFQSAQARADEPIVLVDCDGRVANELIDRRRSLDTDDEKSLAGAVLAADALILAVDAAATPAQVEENFAEFGRFLHLLEASRGDRGEVGGLPVFLVLTKCDLLARPDDTSAAWIERIENRKRHVTQRFKDFLAEHVAAGFLPFGSVDLHVWATAVKRPPLKDTPAQPREPFGVAELFRQVFGRANVYQDRQDRSSRRLAFTATGAAGLVAAMLSLAGVFFFGRTQEDPALAELSNKVAAYRAREPQTPSARLREPSQPRVSELTDLKNDAVFSHLPRSQREFVESRLNELLAYRQLRQKLLEISAPMEAVSEQELDKIAAALHANEPPAEYRAIWGQTEAVLLREQRLQDVKAIRAALADVQDWYRRMLRRGEELWTFADSTQRGGPIPWRDWHAQVRALLDEAEAPPFAANRPGYAPVLRFDRVADDRAAWSSLKQRLQRVRDTSAALGLAGDAAGLPAVLDLPPPSLFTTEQASARLQELEKAYPRYQQELILAGLPDAAIGEVRRAAKRSYDRAIAAGREVVSQHLREVGPGNPDTPDAWRRLLPWLMSPDDLRAWRTLATLLARLHNPDAEDPVRALHTFLRQERFDLDLRRLTLVVPDDLKVRPAGNFTVSHGAGGALATAFTFEPAEDGRRDPRRRVTEYAFRPAADASFVYRPGDTLSAELPLRDVDNQEWQFTWTSSRSQVFAFERLSRPPRLHRKDQESALGKVVEEVTLTVMPERGLPVVPDLLPAVAAK